MNDLTEQMTTVFEAYFASVTPHSHLNEKGGFGYYGVGVDRVFADGPQVDLTLTFKKERRYCCFELICHFPHYSKRSWETLRNIMDRNGLALLALPNIRHVHAIIQSGAVMVPTPNPNGPAYVADDKSYTTGPFAPLLGTKNS